MPKKGKQTKPLFTSGDGSAEKTNFRLCREKFKKASNSQPGLDALALYQKYQEKAKLPIYTTYSKADWSQIRLVTIGVATPSRIRQWAEKTLPNGKVVGEVTNANTLHHKTFKPIKGGLFCERIFGPLKDFECACSSSLGKKIKKLKKQTVSLTNQKNTQSAEAALQAQQHLQDLLEKKVAMSSNSTFQNNQRFFCPQCDVEYTWSVMRRYQLGYINLNAPVAHVWYLKSSPNFLSLLLDMKRKHIEYVTYCTETLTLENSLKSSAEVLRNVVNSRAVETPSYDYSGTRILNSSNTPLTKKQSYYFQKQIQSPSLSAFRLETQNSSESTGRSAQSAKNNDLILKIYSSVRKTESNLLRGVDLHSLESSMSYMSENIDSDAVNWEQVYKTRRLARSKNAILTACEYVRTISSENQNNNFRNPLRGLATADLAKIETFYRLEQGFSNDELTNQKQSAVLDSNVTQNLHQAYVFANESETAVFNKDSTLNGTCLNSHYHEVLSKKLLNNPNLVVSSSRAYTSLTSKKTNLEKMLNRIYAERNKSTNPFLRLVSQKSVLGAHPPGTGTVCYKKLSRVVLLKELLNKVFGTGLRKLTPATMAANLSHSPRSGNLRNKLGKNLDLRVAGLLNSKEQNKKLVSKTNVGSARNANERLIISKFLKTSSNDLPNTNLTKCFLGLGFAEVQKNYIPLRGGKTIINNMYCFSHRVLWNHAVDWQFFALYFYPTPFATSSMRGAQTSSTSRKNRLNLDDINVPVYAYRNYDFSLLNTFFSNPKQTSASKLNFTQSLDDKQNLHVNYSGAGILKTLLVDYENSAERSKIYKQHVMILFALNKHILKTKQVIFTLRVFKLDALGTKSRTRSKTSGTTLGKPGLSAYKKKYKELCQQRELIMSKIKLLRTLFSSQSNKLATRNKENFAEQQLLRAEGNTQDIVLSVVPVLPPDLRPIVKMGTQIAASDLNRFYQRIIYRNDRLKRFLKDAAINGSYEMKYAQRLLQEAVDNLIQNGKSGVTPEKDARGRLLKSLSDILKGKQGRFRQYLLGKRVDYSGRSVIVVGPNLKLHECGIPKEMALELFLPFLIKRILSSNLARTVIGAKNLIKNNKPLTWALLREILKTSPVLLNRAPTLHRLGFQAFQPKLVDGRAVLLHPLVCPAFNADFDGDQMAVHVPISPEARAEAWKLMLSRNNLLSPATGEPLVLPSQDMVLGCYYLTTNCNVRTQKLEKGYGLYFNSLNDVLRAYQQGLLSIHAIIWVKWNGKVENSLRSHSRNSLEEPAEIRLNLYGGSHVIYSRSYSTFNYSSAQSAPVEQNLDRTLEMSRLEAKKSRTNSPRGLELVNTIIRTTPGKILFNVMLGMALKPSSARTTLTM